MIDDQLVEKSKNVYRTGLARFLFMAMSYIKNTKKMKEMLEKKDIYFRLALEAPDWPNPCVLLFKNKQLNAIPISKEDLADKSNWDAKVIAPAENLLEYFLGGHVIIPILLRKLKVKGMMKIMKVLWFIQLALEFFAHKTTFSRATFGQIFHPD